MHASLHGRLALLVAGFSVLATCPALAAPGATPHAGTWEVGLLGGYKISGKDLQLGDAANKSESPDNSALGGVRVALALTEAFAAEVEGTWAPTQWRSDHKSVNVAGFRASVLFHLMNGAFRPFVRGGFGNETLLNLKANVRADTDSATAWGVGAKYDVNDLVGLRADMLLVNTAGAHQLSEQNYEFLLGLSGKLGRAAPPPPPPPVVPPPVMLPPPATDTDHDGLLDNADKCPNEAEDKDGFQDDDGCPEADNDGDGVVDQADRCPNEAEDKDGFEDDDGCPDRDNDKDGIVDGADRCPNEVETKNLYQDQDGCPDTVPEALASLLAAPVEGLEFDTGKATLKKAAQKVLDNVFLVMEAYKDAHLEVGVHVEAKGDADAQQALSQQRAEAIKKYLTDKGTGEERLKAVGHGASKPLVEGKDAKSQAKNRRVEFKLIP